MWGRDRGGGIRGVMEQSTPFINQDFLFKWLYNIETDFGLLQQ